MADVHDMRAATGEFASAARYRPLGLLDGLNLAAPARVRIGQRDGTDQELRVGMFGLLDDQLDVPDLGNDSLIENDDRFAELVRGRQVVGDIDQRNTKVLV